MGARQGRNQKKEAASRNVSQLIMDTVNQYSDRLKDLSERERLFVIFYLNTQNKKLAWELSAPATSPADSSASTRASAILAKPVVRRLIEEYEKALLLPALTVKARYAAMADITMDDFIEVKNGKPTFDWKKAQRRGAIGAIKKLKFDKKGKHVSEFEIYDPEQRLAQYARLEGLFKDNLVLTTDDENSPLSAIKNRMGEKKK